LTTFFYTVAERIRRALGHRFRSLTADLPVSEGSVVDELQEQHAYYSNKRIRLRSTGETGVCHEPCACYIYAVTLDGTGESIQVDVTDMDVLPDTEPPATIAPG
jgi:hypothetical protein